MGGKPSFFAGIRGKAALVGERKRYLHSFSLRYSKDVSVPWIEKSP
jgi:hypothetical protein